MMLKPRLPCICQASPKIPANMERVQWIFIHLQEIHYLTFDLDLGVKVTRNVAQYALHLVTYSATKFEVATSYGFGGDTFTRNVTDWPSLVRY